MRRGGVLATWASVVALASSTSVRAEDPRAYAGVTEIAAVEPTATEPVPRRSPPPAGVIAHAHAPASPARPRPQAHARWALDAVITGGAGIPYLVLELLVTPHRELEPIPAGRPSVGAIDRGALDRYSPPAAIASDVLVGLLTAGGPALSGLDAGWSAPRGSPGRLRVGAARWGGDALLQIEALALTGLFVTVIKSAVARPRPYTSLEISDVPAGDRAELLHDFAKPDRTHSFPSAHTAFAFASVTSLATLWTLHAPRTRRGRAAIATVWAVGLALATTVGVLRVVAGKHYPTDVLAGAALGGGIGAAVPLLHLRPRRGRR